MKKTWVKRENIYYKPFYKEKSKMLLLAIFALGIMFFSYQVFSINQLPNASTPWSLETAKQVLKNKQNHLYPDETSIKIIRGIRLFDYDNYKPNFERKFKCLDSNVVIPFDRVNDNFCDCITDGSDEPSTNACAKGRFYCKYQKRHITGRGRDIFVSSNRINDGVCDCCDGSDEWTTTKCKNKCT